MHSRSKTGLTLIFAGIILLCFTNVSAAQQNEEIPEQYYSANALYNRKLYTLALEEYSAFLQARPLHEKAVRARLGLALCRKIAEGHGGRLTLLNPGAPGARFELALPG